MGSYFSFSNGFSLDIQAHYVDHAKWYGLLGNVDIDDYFRLDMKISQRLLQDGVELSLVGQNLLDKLHPETSDSTGTYETERLIYGQITFYYR